MLCILVMELLFNMEVDCICDEKFKVFYVLEYLDIDVINKNVVCG